MRTLLIGILLSQAEGVKKRFVIAGRFLFVIKKCDDPIAEGHSSSESAETKQYGLI